MEKGWSSSQDQPWSNSFFTSHPVRYPHSRSRHHHRHRRRSFVNSMMKTSRIVFFTIIFVTLWLPPHCLAERIPGNGLEDSGGGGGRELRRVRRGAGGPCLPEEFLAPVRTAFQKIIPTFNSRSLTIQLKTDLRLGLGPQDPELVAFLQSYYSTASRKINGVKSSPSISTSDRKMVYAAMSLYFNKEYARFLTKVGVPLSCISYFLGMAETEAVFQLQKLTQSLQKRHLSKESTGFTCLFGEGTSGSQVMDMLKVTSQEAFDPNNYDPTQDSTDCDEMILYMKDGSIMVKMPIIDMGRKELALPYLDSSLQLGQVEVPTEIGHYIATGLKCLENNGQRWNFTCKVIDWMQNDLVYQIVRTPTCIQGFGGILPFIVSIKDFSNYLRDYRSSDEANIVLSDEYDYSVQAEGSANSRSLNSDFQKISDGDRAPVYIYESAPINYEQFYMKLPTTTVNNTEEHDHHKSSWFFTLFMLLILLILCCWAYSVFCGYGCEDCIRCIRGFGMQLKNEGIKRRPHRRRAKPTYTVLPSETEETAVISEKDDTSVFSMPVSEPEPEPEPEPVKEEPPPPPPPSPPPPIQVCECPKRTHKKKHPIVEIHSTGRESIRLEIQTDTECDDFVTTISQDESTMGSETCHMSELDFDLGENEYDGDDNGSVTSAGYGRRHDEMNFVANGGKTPYFSFTEFYDDGTTSAAESKFDSNFRMSPKAEKKIYDRYAGPNEPSYGGQGGVNDVYKASRLLDYDVSKDGYFQH